MNRRNAFTFFTLVTLQYRSYNGTKMKRPVVWVGVAGIVVGTVIVALISWRPRKHEPPLEGLRGVPLVESVNFEGERCEKYILEGLGQSSLQKLLWELKDPKFHENSGSHTYGVYLSRDLIVETYKGDVLMRGSGKPPRKSHYLIPADGDRWTVVVTYRPKVGNR